MDMVLTSHLVNHIQIVHLEQHSGVHKVIFIQFRSTAKLCTISSQSEAQHRVVRYGCLCCFWSNYCARFLPSACFQLAVVHSL